VGRREVLHRDHPGRPGRRRAGHPQVAADRDARAARASGDGFGAHEIRGPALADAPEVEVQAVGQRHAADDGVEDHCAQSGCGPPGRAGGLIAVELLEVLGVPGGDHGVVHARIEGAAGRPPRVDAEGEHVVRLR
jgi:hypothetical protein